MSGIFDESQIVLLPATEDIIGEELNSEFCLLYINVDDVLFWMINSFLENPQYRCITSPFPADFIAQATLFLKEYGVIVQGTMDLGHGIVAMLNTYTILQPILLKSFAACGVFTITFMERRKDVIILKIEPKLV